uniref:Putative secreted peptide n=1 Tax=Anopheles braziliensis TaxID=58242 RepID=A0A2M3ZNR2_9DIPT
MVVPAVVWWMCSLMMVVNRSMTFPTSCAWRPQAMMHRWPSMACSMSKQFHPVTSSIIIRSSSSSSSGSALFWRNVSDLWRKTRMMRFASC